MLHCRIPRVKVTIRTNPSYTNKSIRKTYTPISRKVVPSEQNRNMTVVRVPKRTYVTSVNPKSTTTTITKTLTDSQIAEIRVIIEQELSNRDLISLYTTEALNSVVVTLTGLTCATFILIIANEIRYRNTQKKIHKLLDGKSVMRIM